MEFYRILQTSVLCHASQSTDHLIEKNVITCKMMTNNNRSNELALTADFIFIEVS